MPEAIVLTSCSCPPWTSIYGSGGGQSTMRWCRSLLPLLPLSRLLIRGDKQSATRDVKPVERYLLWGACALQKRTVAPVCCKPGKPRSQPWRGVASLGVFSEMALSLARAQPRRLAQLDFCLHHYTADVKCFGRSSRIRGLSIMQCRLGRRCILPVPARSATRVDAGAETQAVMIRRQGSGPAIGGDRSS
jgi:hypothetical protein